jgi:uncharacterized protein with HEPN domain
MNERDESRLRDMLDNAEKALHFAEGKSRENIEQDELLVYAIIHAIQIIGEAARNVSRELQEAYPEVEWIPIQSTRNRIAHGYMHVDFQIIWNILQFKLPELIAQIRQMLASPDD